MASCRRPADADFSGGKSSSRSGWQTWNMASRFARSLSACSPSDLTSPHRAVHLRRDRARDRSRSVCPPCATAISRATLFRVGRNNRRHASPPCPCARPCAPGDGLFPARVRRAAPAGHSKRRRGVGRTVESGAKRIAPGLEDVAAMLADGLSKQSVVSRQRRAHRHALGFPQSRAALDIGEQECHRPRGQSFGLGFETGDEGQLYHA